MNKDVIYIDVEDDITAIVSKIKDSKEKIIALVPPKRTGVLQSAVNLRLLARAAKNSDKRVVLITNNASLISLAAAASIPVAKNLQSKPEIPELSSTDDTDSEDVIDGNDLPVGDHAGMSDDGNSEADLGKAAAVASIAASEDVVEAASNTAPSGSRRSKTPGTKRAGMKVPNFTTFRKKLFLGIIGGLALIVFLVWAFVFAPHATIIISAKTSSESVNTDVIVGDSLQTSVKKGTLKAIVGKQSDDVSIDFTATGTKNLGNKAAGDVTFTKSSEGATSVAAGTRLRSSSGLYFVVDEDVAIPSATLSFSCPGFICPGKVSGSVTAEKAGASYNAASGNLSGAPDDVTVALDDPTSGGTDKKVKVVTEADVQKAKQELVDQQTDDTIEELKNSFEGEVVVLEETFTTDYAKVDSSPAVGEEASDSNASLTGKVTYKLYAVAKAELDDFLKKTLEANLDNADEQRVYDSGAEKAQFQDVTKKKVGGEATLVATGQVGPKIDEDDIKDRSIGKRFGDIQADIQSIQGVSSVDVDFFPFWVSSVPNDVKRVSVEFKLDESN